MPSGAQQLAVSLPGTSNPFVGRSSEWPAKEAVAKRKNCTCGKFQLPGSGTHRSPLAQPSPPSRAGPFRKQAVAAPRKHRMPAARGRRSERTTKERSAPAPGERLALSGKPFGGRTLFSRPLQHTQLKVKVGSCDSLCRCGLLDDHARCSATAHPLVCDLRVKTGKQAGSGATTWSVGWLVGWLACGRGGPRHCGWRVQTGLV